MASCECDTCVRSDNFVKRTAHLSESDKHLFWELYDILLEREFDLDYYKCLVDGNWPSADDVIHKIRKRKIKAAEIEATTPEHKKTLVYSIQTGRRLADVNLLELGSDTFEVQMFEDKLLKNSVIIVNHSMHFIRDVADNWVNGIIK